MLTNETQDKIVRDRSCPIEARLPPFSLDMIFLGKPYPPSAFIAASPASRAASEDRYLVMLASAPHGKPASNSAAALNLIRLAASTATRLCDRELHALIHADRTIEYAPLVCIFDGVFDKPATVTNRVATDSGADPKTAEKGPDNPQKPDRVRSVKKKRETNR